MSIKDVWYYLLLFKQGLKLWKFNNYNLRNIKLWMGKEKYSKMIENID